MKIARNILVVATCALIPACADGPLDPGGGDMSPAFAKPDGAGGGGMGGGKDGNPDETSLSVVLEPGTVTSDGLGAYVDGEVSAIIGGGGTLFFTVGSESGRELFIDEIRDGSGNVLVPLTGLTGGGIFTKACCDLREMTSDSAGIQLTRTGEGETLPVKLSVEWAVGTSSYKLTMGSNSNCIDPGPGGDPPDDDPGRGAWARVSRAIVGADTTWTIEDGGPAAVCEFIDEKGKKNDQEVLQLDAVADLRMILSTLP